MKTNSLGVEITRPDQSLIIMRGIPGAGKSTEAKKLVGEGIIHSTDTVIESQGDYRVFFDKMVKSEDFTPLSRAHSTNLKNAVKSMTEGVSPVIVDNTNIKANEAKNYVVSALKMGYDDANISIVDVGSNGLSASVLAERNTHGVPMDKIEKMIQSHKTVGNLTLTKILESKDMFKQSDVLYSAVLLDTASRTKLLSMVGGSIPNGWSVIAHHMTIVFGKGVDKEEVGKNVVLTVTRLGLSDMAMAVNVSGYPSNNAIPHITIAVNPNGGKPVMSNDITKWQDIKPFMVSGIVTEFKRR